MTIVLQKDTRSYINEPNKTKENCLNKELK